MGAIPVVGGLAEAIYQTSKTLGEQRRATSLRNQEDFFILVMSRLRSLAEQNPVVAFLDDLQWADASSLSLLLYLSKNLHDLPYPMLLIGSFRAEDVRRGRRHAQTGDVERHPLEEKINVLMRYDACREIALGAFDRTQIESYVTQRFPGNGFGARFIDELGHVSGGNALFVQEMLTNMQERGIIAERDGRWVLSAQPDYSKLPRTVEGVIRERYERLAEELREMLQVAAVEGEEFSFEVLEAILQENRLALNRRIDKLMNRHALVHRSEKLSEHVMRLYEFTHNLVQKYIYYSMEEDFRREIHRMIAATLKELLGEEGVRRWPEQYSLHLGAGEGIIDERRQILLDSAPRDSRTVAALNEYLDLQKAIVERHLAEYNSDEAINGCDHVMALMSVRGDDATIQLEYSRKKAKVLDRVGRWNEAEDVYRQQLATVRESGDRSMEANVLTSLADLVRRTGRIDEAERFHREGERIAREIGDRLAIARSVGYRGLLHWRRREYDEALECYREQEEIARDLGERGYVSMALGNRGSVYADLGQYERAIECYDESELIALEMDDHLGVANSVGNRGTIYMDQGEFDKALECFREEERIERAVGYRKGVAHAVGNRGTIHLDRKEFADALACFHEAARGHREIGFLYSLTSWLSEIVRALVEIVETESEQPQYLMEFVPELHDGSDSAADDWHAVTLRHARRQAEECISISNELKKTSTRHRSQVLLARIAALEGSVDHARQELRALLQVETTSEDTWREDRRADLHYWLWKLGDTTEDHRDHALSLYRTLAATVPDREYEERIVELRDVSLKA